MRKCQHCGTEYIKNPCIPPFFTDEQKKRLEYIPVCDCLLKAANDELKAIAEKQDEENSRYWTRKFENLSIIDEKFEESTFENDKIHDQYTTISRNYTEKFIDGYSFKKRGMLYHGDTGTGKTFQSACIANELMKRKKKVLVINLGKYLNLIKADENWAKMENEILKHVSNADLLVIDDLGTEHVTPWMLEKTFNLIDERYRSMNHTIITSNLDMVGITEIFGDRIGDRINEMCSAVAFKGESRRGEFGNFKLCEA